MNEVAQVAVQAAEHAAAIFSAGNAVDQGPDNFPSALLARFAAAYPGVHLEVCMGLSRELREGLAEGVRDALADGGGCHWPTAVSVPLRLV